MSVIQEMLSSQAALLKAKPKLTSLKQSCDGMEAAFLKQVVSLMRKSAGNIHFGKELGGEMYRDMFDDSVANMLAQKGTVGLGKAMFASMAPRVLNSKISTEVATGNVAATVTEDNKS